MEYDGFDFADEMGDLQDEYFDPDMLQNLPPEVLDQITPEFLEELQQKNPALFEQLMQSSSDFTDDSVFVLFDNFPGVIDQCLIPVFTSSVQIIMPILLVSVLCRIISQCLSSKLLINIANILGGAFVLYYYTSAAVFYMLLAILGYISFCLLFEITGSSKRSYGVTTIYFMFLTYCNFFVDAKIWHQVMGPQIVLCMKILSLEFDLASGRIESEPTMDTVLGYLFHPATVLFGPWVNFKMYLNTFIKPPVSIWSRMIAHSIKFAFLSSFSLLYSSCFTNFVIGGGAHKWLKAYFVAQSFRTSHYFVQYISSMSATVSGFTVTDERESSNSDEVKVQRIKYKQVHYVDPLRVEFPRSMGLLANNWNLYMNDWFKTYVFHELKHYGVFKAVFGVYMVSSLLHGAKFQVSAVLLTIGVISYAEYLLRARLARTYSACILSTACAKNCHHRYKSRNFFVIVANLCFTLLNVFHLIYLGAPFDNSDVSNIGYNFDHTVSVWANLGFASHYALIFTFAIGKVI
ncbi:protein-serine O-palmitoleoyltransferase porcupine-like [Symsagittifera roscoffensis]|uniref:protein-serine O-palmitoleoyltransferase porcupine-like n=1 Tax=Symsagittifera roscoffensis TaxID=84072 RepID=UPI00307B5804